MTYTKGTNSSGTSDGNVFLDYNAEPISLGYKGWREGTVLLSHLSVSNMVGRGHNELAKIINWDLELKCLTSGGKIQ